MNISFIEDEKELTYIITDCSKYSNIIESQFYTLKDGKYIKKFSKEWISDIQVLKNNYTKYAENMFLQMGYFQEVLWEEALFKFIKMIEKYDINWWLTGSCALCLRGLNIKPHDVDIMLDAKDINKLNRIFKDYVVEPISSSRGWVVNYFGVLFLEARIDLAFDPADFVDDPFPSDFGPYASKNLEEIEWKGNVVRIPPLKIQLDVNKRRNRSDTVKAIEEFMKTTTF